jgi:hypothetical protein
VAGDAPIEFQIPVNGYSSIVAQAGTAMSRRTHAEQNTFNVIRAICRAFPSNASNGMPRVERLQSQRQKISGAATLAGPGFICNGNNPTKLFANSKFCSSHKR